jgi:hypothetical protein
MRVDYTYHPPTLKNRISLCAENHHVSYCNLDIHCKRGVGFIGQTELTFKTRSQNNIYSYSLRRLNKRILGFQGCYAVSNGK